MTGTDHPPPPWNVDDVTRAMSGGGGVHGGACECRSGGVCQFFVWWMTSRRQCPTGGACECSFTPPFRKSCIRAWNNRPTIPGQQSKGGGGGAIAGVKYSRKLASLATSCKNMALNCERIMEKSRNFQIVFGSCLFSPTVQSALLGGSPPPYRRRN